MYIFISYQITFVVFFTGISFTTRERFLQNYNAIRTLMRLWHGKRCSSSWQLENELQSTEYVMVMVLVEFHLSFACNGSNVFPLLNNQSVNINFNEIPIRFYAIRKHNSWLLWAIGHCRNRFMNFYQCDIEMPTISLICYHTITIATMFIVTIISVI